MCAGRKHTCHKLIPMEAAAPLSVTLLLTFNNRLKKCVKRNCSAKLHVNTNINSKLETHLDWRSARLWRRRSFDVRAECGDWARQRGRRS